MGPAPEEEDVLVDKEVIVEVKEAELEDPEAVEDDDPVVLAVEEPDAKVEVEEEEIDV